MAERLSVRSQWSGVRGQVLGVRCEVLRVRGQVLGVKDQVLGSKVRVRGQVLQGSTEVCEEPFADVMATPQTTGSKTHHSNLPALYQVSLWTANI